MAAMGTKVPGEVPVLLARGLSRAPRKAEATGLPGRKGGCVCRGHQSAPELEAARAATPLPVLDRSPRALSPGRRLQSHP